MSSYVNKVILGDEVLIDLTNDTITADKLFTGVTAHLPSGEVITGTMFEGAPDEVTVEIDGEEYTYVKKKGNIKWYGVIDEDVDPDRYTVVAEYPDGEDPDIGDYIYK